MPLVFLLQIHTNWQFEICTCYASVPNPQAIFMSSVSHKQAKDTEVLQFQQPMGFFWWTLVFTHATCSKISFVITLIGAQSVGGVSNTLSFSEGKCHCAIQLNGLFARVHTGSVIHKGVSAFLFLQVCSDTYLMVLKPWNTKSLILRSGFQRFAYKSVCVKITVSKF